MVRPVSGLRKAVPHPGPRPLPSAFPPLLDPLPRRGRGIRKRRCVRHLCHSRARCLRFCHSCARYAFFFPSPLGGRGEGEGGPLAPPRASRCVPPSPFDSACAPVRVAPSPLPMGEGRGEGADCACPHPHPRSDRRCAASPASRARREERSWRARSPNLLAHSPTTYKAGAPRQVRVAALACCLSRQGKRRNAGCCPKPLTRL